ncbi:hypothetical protein BT96DRAFT_955898 [Gymnopus androsaceus JB14]|uniref:NmrA-like domain-containing protein n=1 Tax=Gymnopus androsaceus JB14 TaxID=1447944 RepID=A0A6A4I4E0_9AGAR|nr:hypothetical protein BT96DRAFT_955898 [Gymnopus androsaceus JB14]
MTPDISYAGATASIISIDYQDQQSIRKVLIEYQIDTIISTIAGPSPDGFITAQESLLRAGLSVPTFRRFSPSNYAFDPEQLKTVKLYQMKLLIIASLCRAKQERPNSFEYCRFNGGVYMNYLGYGNTKPDGDKAHGYIGHFPYFVDLSKRTVDVPGDGEKQIVYTRAEDVEKFVAAASQLEVWEEHGDMAGEVLTINELIRTCEDVCGAKLNVKYNTREEIVARMDTDPKHIMVNMYLEVCLAFIDGACDVKRPMNLNKLDVKPMGVREYLEKWWSP